MSIQIKPLPGTTIDPLYPDTDGKPMGETDFHIIAVILLREALEDFLAGRTAYVASNMLLYFDQGNPAGKRDPDVLVALGVDTHVRRSFRTWEEGTVPNVLFEIASEHTWREDLTDKRAVYQHLGVPEYFLFDPEGRFLDPVLQGFRLVDGAYLPMEPAADGSLTSEELGLRLVPEGGMLRLIDARTGAPVLTRQEQLAQRDEQLAQRDQQLAQRDQQLAQQQEQFDAERRRADELAAELARLRAEREGRNGG
jgi:Uma2 family endonuclease